MALLSPMVTLIASLWCTTALAAKAEHRVKFTYDDGSPVSNVQIEIQSNSESAVGESHLVGAIGTPNARTWTLRVNRKSGDLSTPAQIVETPTFTDGVLTFHTDASACVELVLLAGSDFPEPSRMRRGGCVQGQPTDFKVWRSRREVTVSYQLPKGVSEAPESATFGLVVAQDESPLFEAVKASSKPTKVGAGWRRRFVISLKRVPTTAEATVTLEVGDLRFDELVRGELALFGSALPFGKGAYEEREITVRATATGVEGLLRHEGLCVVTPDECIPCTESGCRGSPALPLDLRVKLRGYGDRSFECAVLPVGRGEVGRVCEIEAPPPGGVPPARRPYAPFELQLSAGQDKVRFRYINGRGRILRNGLELLNQGNTDRTWTAEIVRDRGVPRVERFEAEHQWPDLLDEKIPTKGFEKSPRSRVELGTLLATRLRLTEQPSTPGRNWALKLPLVEWGFWVGFATMFRWGPELFVGGGLRLDFRPKVSIDANDVAVEEMRAVPVVSLLGVGGLRYRPPFSPVGFELRGTWLPSAGWNAGSNAWQHGVDWRAGGIGGALLFPVPHGKHREHRKDRLRLALFADVIFGEVLYASSRNPQRPPSQLRLVDRTVRFGLAIPFQVGKK
jgi:hypothetical protein